MDIYFELPTLLKKTSESVDMLAKSTGKIEMCIVILTSLFVSKTVYDYFVSK